MAITKGEVGGAQEYVKVVSTGLVTAGHEVGVLVTAPSALASAVQEAGARVFSWNSVRRNPSPWRDLQARRELRNAVEAWVPDLVHLNSSKAGVLGVGVLSPRLGATVFTCHHAPFGPGRQLSHRVISRPIEQLMLPRLDGIISVGRRDLPALGGIAPRVPLRHIPNAVPVKGPPRSTGPLRPTALWVARLASPKDPLLAVRMWELVVQQVPEARLAVCGTGPLAERLRRTVAASPIRDAIEVVGFAKDLGPLQEWASLFVLCTRVEGGLTMATLEAMAAGLVPVVSDAGDAFLLDELACGVHVQEPGPGPFASQVIGLLSDAPRFERLRVHALAHARGRTVADMVNETVDFYHYVLERRLIGAS